jgi:release factor glutamine methyltransferase
MNLSWDDGFRQIRDLSIDRPVSLDEQHVFQTYLERRANHEPLQYILGQWDFLDYTLTIRSPLLCPRPETEELVLMVVNDIRTTTALARPRPARPCRILDVGCGTGAIGIALCALLPNVHVTAMDIEPVAVTTSNENARRILGETQNQYRAILCSATDFPPKNEDGDGEGLLLWDAVVSNPPYIPTLDMTDLDETVVNFESHEALCGGPDGLDVVRDIIAKLPTWCNPEAPCWMEVDPSHPRSLERWLGTSNSTDSTDGDHDQDVIFVSGHKDMFGLDRFVKLKVRS